MKSIFWRIFFYFSFFCICIFVITLATVALTSDFRPPPPPEENFKHQTNNVLELIKSVLQNSGEEEFKKNNIPTSINIPFNQMTEKEWYDYIRKDRKFIVFYSKNDDVAKKAYFVVPVLIDGAQGIQHQKVDVVDLDCDFYCFSGHKIYGPTGIGVLYGKEKWLDDLPPYQGGGDMIKSVSFEKTNYNDLPFKFEAGTTPYIQAIGLGQAIKYIENITMDKVIEHDKLIINYTHEKLNQIPELTIYGTSKNKSSIFSFLLKDIHHFDTGMMLDKLDIAVRTGTHCTMPLMKHYGIEGTVRASFGIYNTTEEIDIFYDSILKIIKMFKH